MDFPELGRRPLNTFQGPSPPRRTRHRVDAGEPRGCFSVFHNNSSMDYAPPPGAGNRLLSEYSQQQLLREMLERRPKLGFEETFDERAVKINGCKKRKLYQPLRNGGEIQEAETMSGGGPELLTRRGSLSPTNNFMWGNGKRALSPLLSPQPKPPALHTPFPPLPSLHQWKESFKAHLLASVAELVDSQFQSFFQALPPIPPPPPPQQQMVPLKLNQLQNNQNHRMFKAPPAQPQLPPAPHFTSALLHLNNNYQASREDCESPLSLVVSPKKKRHKVTDTRLTPRAVSRLLDAASGPTYIDESPGYFNSNYSSPPASLKEFMQSQIGAGSGGSASGVESDGSISNDDSNLAGPINGSSATLTPMHLRKAKLMFFWVRYPSSAVLKMYFPDIKFNKNNTAQLVKWFSNFREFYYIQMEKYARQALSEGVKNAEEIHVSVDHELYRVLNLHYNRNNHIEVPSNFRFVVEQTLREFLKAIQLGKDSEQSWKKAIYKIIARLDDPVPDYFKSPNFLEQLE